MVAKSQATAAWDRRNCDQVTSERVGAGSIRALLRICQTVDAARRWPSPASSPWMRRYPQVGFSAARRSASRRSSAEVDGRPGGRCGWVQCPTMRRRCQRSSVSGVTSHPARLGRASAAAIAASKVRSASVSSGRSIWRRSTASWWRNTMISRSFERPDRTVSRASDARNRYRFGTRGLSIGLHRGRSTTTAEFPAPTGLGQQSGGRECETQSTRIDRVRPGQRLRPNIRRPQASSRTLWSSWTSGERSRLRGDDRSPIHH